MSITQSVWDLGCLALCVLPMWMTNCTSSIVFVILLSCKGVYVDGGMDNFGGVAMTWETRVNICSFNSNLYCGRVVHPLSSPMLSYPPRPEGPKNGDPSALTQPQCGKKKNKNIKTQRAQVLLTQRCPPEISEFSKLFVYCKCRFYPAIVEA